MFLIDAIMVVVHFYNLWALVLLEKNQNQGHHRSSSSLIATRLLTSADIKHPMQVEQAFIDDRVVLVSYDGKNDGYKAYLTNVFYMSPHRVAWMAACVRVTQKVFILGPLFSVVKKTRYP